MVLAGANCCDKERVEVPEKVFAEAGWFTDCPCKELSCATSERLVSFKRRLSSSTPFTLAVASWRLVWLDASAVRRLVRSVLYLSQRFFDSSN